MHSIIKNLSKVLALTILSTSFQPNFVSAGNTRRNSKAQHTEAKSAAKMSNHQQLFNQQIERFTKLGEGQFIVADDFKIQDSYENAYLMLKQLNDLFDKYPNVLKAFIEHCKAFKTPFTLYKLKPTPVETLAPADPRTGKRPRYVSTTQSSTSGNLDFMLLFVPKTVTDLRATSNCGATARVDITMYLQAVVTHEFGHIMSFLKCITDYCAKHHTSPVTLPDAEQQVYMYNAHSQEIRDAIACKYGYAPYISYYANQELRPTTKLPRNAELTKSANDEVNAEYFAELFAYTECNSTAPKRIKTALREIIDTWF